MSIALQNTKKKNERASTCSEALTDARIVSVQARAVNIVVRAIIVAGVSRSRSEKVAKVYYAKESYGDIAEFAEFIRHEGYICWYFQTITYVRYELSAGAESDRENGKRPEI